MAQPAETTVECQICRKAVPRWSATLAEVVRPALLETIRKYHPDWDNGGYICFEDLNHLRSQYVEDVLREEKGELSTLEEEVIRSYREH
jgi:hypothetical protein